MGRARDSVGLADAARIAGVHYQTAYRWVRTGRLPATRVAGQYVVARTDLDALVAARSHPAPPPPPRPTRLARQADRMHEALLTGDEGVARTIARRLTDDGSTVTDLIGQVLVPPLRRIGAAWRAGELDIWVEHRASAIVERILGDLHPNPRGRRRGVAVVAALSGDHHALPTAMAAAALREDNWSVHHLGADMPADDLERFCDGHEVDLAVLTVTTPEAAGPAEALASRLGGRGIPTLVGGPGKSLDDLLGLARALGA
ncbi:MAG TPA: helix-turn-helix domain-containing protein [Acidimicrobiales bacterium]|nr:helix-turn-helix domain-containing protein [Acidimicrobiales bacterium]